MLRQKIQVVENMWMCECEYIYMNGREQISRAQALKGKRWRHQIEPFTALLAICAGNSPVSGEFPAQRPVTRSFDVSFDLRLNQRLSKQS